VWKSALIGFLVGISIPFLGGVLMSVGGFGPCGPASGVSTFGFYLLLPGLFFTQLFGLWKWELAPFLFAFLFYGGVGAGIGLLSRWLGKDKEHE